MNIAINLRTQSTILVTICANEPRGMFASSGKSTAIPVAHVEWRSKAGLRATQLASPHPLHLPLGLACVWLLVRRQRGRLRQPRRVLVRERQERVCDCVRQRRLLLRAELCVGGGDGGRGLEVAKD